MWAATGRNQSPNAVLFISIHAARVGSDNLFIDAQYRRRMISIHAARVGSDKEQFPECFEGGISIHAARVGSDWNAGTIMYAC